MAKGVGDKFFAAFEKNASKQVIWHPEVYPGLWSEYPLPEREAGDYDPITGERTPGVVPIENIFSKSMRKMCFDEARQLLIDNGFDDDEWSLYRTAPAVGVAFQNASVRIQKLLQGGYQSARSVRSHPVVVSSRDAEEHAVAGAEPSHDDTVPVSLTDMVEDWWRESKVIGRKPSTYESYRNTISTFVRFLGHDDALRISASDVSISKTMTCHAISTHWQSAFGQNGEGQRSRRSSVGVRLGDPKRSHTQQPSRQGHDAAF
ncbi:MAG: hypothetical protein WBA44_01075 [Mesorhizobium sp.]